MVVSSTSLLFILRANHELPNMMSTHSPQHSPSDNTTTSLHHMAFIVTTSTFPVRTQIVVSRVRDGDAEALCRWTRPLSVYMWDELGNKTFETASRGFLWNSYFWLLLAVMIRRHTATLWTSGLKLPVWLEQQFYANPRLIILAIGFTRQFRDIDKSF